MSPPFGAARFLIPSLNKVPVSVKSKIGSAPVSALPAWAVTSVGLAGSPAAAKSALTTGACEVTRAWFRFPARVSIAA